MLGIVVALFDEALGHFASQHWYVCYWYCHIGFLMFVIGGCWVCYVLLIDYLIGKLGRFSSNIPKGNYFNPVVVDEVYDFVVLCCYYAVILFGVSFQQRF